MAKKNKDGGLWSDVTEQDFLNEENIEDTDISEYNLGGMAIYSANVNLARHIIRVTDSLKPVERRILYAMYKIGAVPGKLVKSEKIVAAAMEVHNHGDAALYDSMVQMVQYWKKNVPLVEGDCNFGTLINPDGYAAKRYSEAQLTDFAYECFFEDYNEKAITFDTHLTGAKEPKFLPTKFPIVLINGSAGIGYGFAPCIPPYNIHDVMDVTKKLMKNPNDPDIIMYPDLPTGCDIVDNPDVIKEICETGGGTLRMRARIDIDGESRPNKWVLHIRSIPFTAPYDKIYESIIQLGKTKKLAIDDIHEYSTPYAENGIVKSKIDLQIVISRSLDPKAVRSFLFKNTDLEKSIAVRFTVVVNDKEIKDVNLRQLLLAWIDERRLYKRSLYNHRINYLESEINIRDIMIELLDKDNLEKTMRIIRNSTTDKVMSSLMKEYGMSSHQAKVVVNKPTGAFTKDARDRYIREREKFTKELNELLDIVYSAKKIDKIILNELDSLNKYATPRKSPIVSIEGEEVISNTNHFIITTERGLIKKLPNPPDNAHKKNALGSFVIGDAPSFVFTANNLAKVFMMDITGKFSVMNVHEIPNSLYNEGGMELYKVAKLDGSIVYAMNLHTLLGDIYKSRSDKPSKKATAKLQEYELITLSEKGYTKRTNLTEYIDDVRSTSKGNKGAKLQEGDKLTTAMLWRDEWSEESDILIYTQYGEYVTINPSMIPLLGKYAQGSGLVRLAPDDKCVGMTPIPSFTKRMNTDSHDKPEYLIVVTSKGYVRKESVEFFANSKKRKDNQYLCSVTQSDPIVAVVVANDKETINVNLKTTSYQIPVSDMKEIPRRAKAIKMIAVATGDKILKVTVGK